MKTSVTEVTPEQASYWLSRNTNNRSVSSKTVELYAREMRSGRWRLTHQGVAIYDDGVLADGQHRLEAIVKSGVTVPMLITTGVPKGSATGIDAHRARSVSDIVKISGNADWLTNKMIQTLREVYSIRKVGADEAVALAEPIKDSLIYVDSLFNLKVKGVTAALRAAVTLAHLHGEDEQRLAEFVSMFYSGLVTSEEDSAVIKLRDHMTQRDGKRGLGGVQTQIDLNKAQNAIQKFINRQPVNSLRVLQSLPYDKLDPKPILENK